MKLNDTQQAEHYVIVGFGWVGQANALSCKLLGYTVSYFDLGDPELHYPQYADVYNTIMKLDTLHVVDSPNTWYFVCVGDRVPEDGKQDISNIQKALDSLSEAEGKVILRSTVLPSLLEQLHFHLYVPEFLHETKAVEESLHPHLFVVGGVPLNKPEPSVFGIWRRRAEKVFKGSPEDAAFVKYLSNVWNATRIAFVNEIGNIIGYPKDAESHKRVENIINFLLEDKEYQRYGRAFGGHCLPKDMRSFLWMAQEQGKGADLIMGAYSSNRVHSELQDNYPHMKEWFSDWGNQQLSVRQSFAALQRSLVRHIKKRINLR